jgi:hypothetical protein
MVKKCTVLALPLDKQVGGEFCVDVRITCSWCGRGTWFLRLTDFQWEHLNPKFLENYLCKRCVEADARDMA